MKTIKFAIIDMCDTAGKLKPVGDWQAVTKPNRRCRPKGNKRIERMARKAYSKVTVQGVWTL